MERRDENAFLIRSHVRTRDRIYKIPFSPLPSNLPHPLQEIPLLNRPPPLPPQTPRQLLPLLPRHASHAQIHIPPPPSPRRGRQIHTLLMDRHRRHTGIFQGWYGGAALTCDAGGYTALFCRFGCCVKIWRALISLHFPVISKRRHQTKENRNGGKSGEEKEYPAYRKHPLHLSHSSLLLHHRSSLSGPTASRGIHYPPSLQADLCFSQRPIPSMASQPAAYLVVVPRPCWGWTWRGEFERRRGRARG